MHPPISVVIEPRQRATSTSKVDFELPKLISSIKEGWQLTGENGAVVSALLAGVAAQLFGFFKDSKSYTHASAGKQLAVVALCYFAMIFNIGAAISSFVMMDYLGEVPYYAAKEPTPGSPSLLPAAGSVPGTANGLLRRYGGSPAVWTYISLHCK